VPEEIKPENLVRIYKEFGTELLVKEPKLFDSFTKDGKTSFAYHLVFQSYEKTLTDQEINSIMEKITEKIISLGWQVR
jgi:phenylalanyl-tRNA synthetase beta subunit